MFLEKFALKLHFKTMKCCLFSKKFPETQYEVDDVVLRFKLIVNSSYVDV